MKDSKRAPRRQTDDQPQERTQVTEQEKSTSTDRVVQRVEPAENPISEETGEYLDHLDR